MPTCEDLISGEDLANAKLDTTTLAEVATSRAGGLSTGAPIDSTTNRFGDTVSTVNGQLSKLGYEPPIDYAGAISFGTDDGVKTIERANVIYAPLPSSLPFTTTGTWIGSDESNFYLVQRSGFPVFSDYAALRDIDSTLYSDGDVVFVTDSGIAGNFVLRNSAAHGLTDNGDDIIVIDADWYAERFLYPLIEVGSGSVLKQPNAAFQSVRDHTVSDGLSTHGFIVSDLFAVDTSAMNSFGSDVNVGDGSHPAPFTIDHLHSFQSRNIIELGLGSMTNYSTVITFDELRSGTLSSHRGVLITDLLGQNDTAGLNIPNFEVNGAAQVNSQSGIVTQIKHGLNPRSAHFTAGLTDADVTKTTGGAPVDCECPVIIRQVTPTTSRTTGALVLTDGGIGCNGDINAADEIATNSAAGSFALRSSAGTLLGRTTHNATTMDLINDFSGTLRFGVSATNVLELLSDRFRPIVDGATFLGDSSHRWSTVFSTTGTINTSDENEKNILGGLDDKLLDAWANVDHYLFTWKDSTDAKGEAARVHAGYIAQQVQRSLLDAGIDGFKYGLLCEDELTEEVIKTRPAKRPVMTTVEGEREEFIENERGQLVRTMVAYVDSIPLTREVTVVNEDGSNYLVDSVEVVSVNIGTKENPKYENREKLVKRPLVKSVPVMEVYEEEYTETVKTGKRRMGLRYDQCAIVEAAYLRRELSRLKT